MAFFPITTGNISMTDLVALQHDDRLSGLIEDVTTYSPEVGQIPVIIRPGTSYKIVRRIGLPPAQFRNVNAGVAPGKSAFQQDTKEMYFLDAPVNIDEAVFQADDQSTGSILNHEMEGVLQSAFIYLGQQVWYGTGQDSAGFQGIRAQPTASIYTTTVTAPTSAATTSAYLIWMHPWGVHLDVGNLGQIATNPPMRQQLAVTTTTNAFYWVTNLSFWIGLSVESAYSAWAVSGIKNQAAATTGGPLDDKSGESLISNIPITRRQGLAWFMNRVAQYTLQSTRSALTVQPAVTGGGAPAWPPPPTTLGGYPIVLTDSILNTETN